MQLHLPVLAGEGALLERASVVSCLELYAEVPAKKDRARMTRLQLLLCLCVGAYGVHVLEEYVFDWRNWAEQVLHLPARWDDFYVTNCLVVVVGAVGVAIAPEWPGVALGFPGLMLINGAFMHVMPFILKRGRFSPGLITSLLLFFPLGIASMMAAPHDLAAIVTGFVTGALLLATPIGFIILKHKFPYFDQSRGL
jgi:hypothetical protein